MSIEQKIAIIATLYLLVMLAIILNVITKGRRNWLGLRDDELIPVLLWPITVFWWLVTKIYNLVHPKEKG